MKKRTAKIFFQWLCILALPLLLSNNAFAQAPSAYISRLAMGIELFSQGRLDEAVMELRRLQAEAPSREMRAEALFWISMAMLFAGEFEQSLRDMNTLEETDPGNRRLAQLPYHRGRALFHLGRYDEAIVLLMGYADSIMPGPAGALSAADASRMAAALYWTGACLFYMGQLDRASDMFAHIIEEFPASFKREPSSNRLAMINQRRVEAELLGLLRWSHEESLRSMEEFRRRERVYNQALIAYQRRIADMLRGGGRLQELEYENQRFRRQLRSAEDRIQYLESAILQASTFSEEDGDSVLLERLLALRRYVRELETRVRDSTEINGGSR